MFRDLPMKRIFLDLALEAFLAKRFRFVPDFTLSVYVTSRENMDDDANCSKCILMYSSRHILQQVQGSSCLLYV